MNDGTSEGCGWGIETEDVVARECHLKGWGWGGGSR